MCSDRTLFDAPENRPIWGEREWGLAIASARNLFNPSRPIDEDRLFSGRIDQIRDLLDVIYEAGSHAVIFGERGVGKSSLANTLTKRVPSAVTNIKFYKDNCRPEDTFFSLWSKMLWDFEYNNMPMSEYLKDENREFIAIKILEALAKDKQYVFIFDEFDRLTSPNTKAAMADTIKHFSDYPQNITIIIVGVGSSVDELFGSHPSIQRCCRQIPMQRMSASELTEIVTDRYPKIGIAIDDSIKSEMVSLSQGMPGFVHLLAREGALSTLERKSRSVEKYDYTIAVKESVRKAQESIVTAYKKATYSPKDNIYNYVLLACALAKRDEQGKFSAKDIREQLASILGRNVKISGFSRHLAAFCDEERGAVLRKSGKPRRFQYQFIDATLQPYVVMVGKRDNII
jgi:Cdc6-like AAA superfamily ATPase